jgi:hypothetical protein
MYISAYDRERWPTRINVLAVFLGVCALIAVAFAMAISARLPSAATSQTRHVAPAAHAGAHTR